MCDIEGKAARVGASAGNERVSKGSTRSDEGFALRIVRMFSALPKTTEAQALGKHVFLAI